jgi:hypothetical protein
MEDASKILIEFLYKIESKLTLWFISDCSKLDFYKFLQTSILTN